MKVDISLTEPVAFLSVHALRCLGSLPRHSYYARAAENAALVCRDHQSGPEAVLVDQTR